MHLVHLSLEHHVIVSVSDALAAAPVQPLLLLLPAHSYSPSSPASLWPFPGFVRCPTYAPLLEPRIASRARLHHVACAVYKFAEQSSVSGSNENEWGNGRSRESWSGSGRKKLKFGMRLLCTGAAVSALGLGFVSS